MGAQPGTDVYCIVPRDIAPDVHEPLRRWFADRPDVTVVVERRLASRRRAGRSGPEGAQRRLELPPEAEPHADRLVFVGRPRRAPGDDDRACDQLIVRFHGGEPSAFAELYLRYYERIYDYLRVALHDEDEARDATHEVFADALKALPRYEVREGRPFRAWLFTIARHHAIRHVRRRRPVVAEDPAMIARRREAAPMPRIASRMDWVSDQRLLSLIERLPEQQRLTITMSYLLGLETAEIAELMGRTPESVRQLHHRALRFLEARLAAAGISARQVTREPALALRQPANLLRARRFALARSARALPGARARG